eukprot:jgi/Galph1/5510/GphlegSOOS_G4192.1
MAACDSMGFQVVPSLVNRRKTETFTFRYHYTIRNTNWPLKIYSAQSQETTKKGEFQLPNRIKLIACDVDGTLLNHNNSLGKKTENTVRNVLQQGFPFILATGKARLGALNSVPPLKADLEKQGMGVFLQGLYVVSEGGRICYEKFLDKEIVRRIVQLSKELSVTLVGYHQDRIVCEERNAETDKVIPYHEPVPEPIGSWENLLAEGKATINKMMFMDKPERLDKIRPYIEGVLDEYCHITQAVPGMLEVLPLGASKGQGLLKLLQSLGIDPQDVMAIGDGENDVEMFKYVGCSVAMANAKSLVKEAAKHVTVRTNNEDGVAEALEKFVLRNPFLKRQLTN